MDNRTALTKFTPPQQGEIYPCERLYKSLEQACTRPVVWITGAPGAGKTTLVAGWLAARNQHALWYQLDAGDSDPAAFFHYLRIAARPLSARKRAVQQLTPEHLPSLDAFARRCFETLGASLQHPTMLVLDNYHEIAAGSALHALLAEALPRLPPHVTVIAISRAGPPPAFARLCVNRHIALLGANEFVLNADEAAGLACCLRHSQSHHDIVQLLHRTQGWAAGLVLLLSMDVTIPVLRPVRIRVRTRRANNCYSITLRLRFFYATRRMSAMCCLKLRCCPASRLRRRAR